MTSRSSIRIIKRILGRLKREDFPFIFDSWDCLANANIDDLVGQLGINVKFGLGDSTRTNSNNLTSTTLVNEGTTKKKIIELIIEACKVHGGVHKKDIADLELLCTQLHPNVKRWSAFGIVKEKESVNEIIDPETLCDRFGTQLSMYLKHDLCMRLHDKAIWFRLGLPTKSKVGHLAKSSVFIVFHPHSPYLIATPMRKKDQEVIFQALIDMLEANDITECYLSGSELNSLQEMTLMKDAQGSFSKFRFNQVDRNPLVKIRGKKRKGSVLEKLDIHVTDENSKDADQHNNHTLKVFGSNPQPKLQKLEYKMITRLRGSDFPPALDINRVPFHCTAQLEGNNVIEGIKELVQAGFANLPLPGHLSNVHSLAKNRFLLADKN